MTETKPHSLATTCLRLRSDASIEPMKLDETFWPRLMAGELGTFHNEYLVTMHAFDADWGSWESHPNGDEIVFLIEGRATFVLETDSGEKRVELTDSGTFVFVPKGTWHTAKVAQSARMLFITAGEGTQHRPIGTG